MKTPAEIHADELLLALKALYAASKNTEFDNDGKAELSEKDLEILGDAESLAHAAIWKVMGEK